MIRVKNDWVGIDSGGKWFGLELIWVGFDLGGNRARVVTVSIPYNTVYLNKKLKLKFI